MESSIIPILDTLEDIAHLDQAKYSTAQYQEIVVALQQLDQKIRVVSYNMLFDLDDQKLDIENRWPNRLPRIVEVLHGLQPDILCIQELQEHQIDQLLEKLGRDDFAFYFNAAVVQDGQKGVSKDFDGIAYRKTRFSLLEGKEWIFPHTRKNTVLTMVHLLDRRTGKTLHVLNTHLPFFIPDERENTAAAIASIVKPLAECGAVIIGGDMNTFANRPDLHRLPFLDGTRIEALFAQGMVEDAYRKSLLGHVGPISTFTSRDDVTNEKTFKDAGAPGIILDHFFVSPTVKVLIHGIEPARVENHLPSDHLPIVIDIIIQ